MSATTDIQDHLWQVLKGAGAVLILPDVQHYETIQQAYIAEYGEPPYGTTIRLAWKGIPIRFLSQPAQEVMALFREAAYSLEKGVQIQ